MAKKEILITFLVSQDELDQIDSIWRPNLEYRSRADFVRVKLGLESSNTKKEE